MKLSVSLLAFGLTASAVRVITFDNASLGKTPPGWLVTRTNHGGPAQWEVRSDRSASSKPYVLAQVAADPASDRCPLAIWDGASIRDGEVSVRLKPISGKDVQAGG